MAATVDGTEITVEQVEDLIVTEEATIPKTTFAQFLTFEIQREILAQSIEERWDIEITDDEVEAETERIFEEIREGDETREEMLNSRGFSEEFLRKFARQTLLDQKVREELRETVEAPSADEVDERLAEARNQLTQVCASHILVQTEEEAGDVMDRLQSGEEFGDIAAEVSIDEGTATAGGSLGCASPATYVEPFAEATLQTPVGEVHDQVVETQFGFHVIQVTDRVEPSEEDLPSAEDVEEGLLQSAIGDELGAWFTEQVAAADVEVNERFGTWQTTPQPAVIAPPDE